MNYNFTGKNFVVSEELKEKCRTKLGRLERLFPNNCDAYVSFSAVKQENRIEVTIPLQRRILRAECSAADFYTAMDLAVDALDKQMVKYKNRIKDKSRRDSAFKEEATVYNNMQEEMAAEGDAIIIEKTKKFALKPMDAEEAVMEMEMLGHVFFVFRDSRSEEVNVVYKRNNGSYGLIEPN